MQLTAQVEKTPMRELTRRYWKWEAVGVLLIVVGICVCWALLLLLAEWRFGSEGGTVHWLSPSALVWGAPAFFAGILSATWPTDLLYRRLLADRYEEFRDYQTRKFGYDGRRWMPPFYFICGAMTTTIILSLLDCYLFFGPTAIEIDGLWALQPRSYRYDQVIEIRASDWREGSDGERVEHYTIALHFADGSAWSSGRDTWYSGREDLRDIAAYVSSHSGIPIVELDVMRRVEL